MRVTIEDTKLEVGVGKLNMEFTEAEVKLFTSGNSTDHTDLTALVSKLVNEAVSDAIKRERYLGK